MIALAGAGCRCTVSSLVRESATVSPQSSKPSPLLTPHPSSLGNELNIALKEPNTTRLAAAFTELRALIHEIWDGAR